MKKAEIIWLSAIYIGLVLLAFWIIPGRAQVWDQGGNQWWGDGRGNPYGEVIVTEEDRGNPYQNPYEKPYWVPSEVAPTYPNSPRVYVPIGGGEGVEEVEGYAW